MTAPRTCRSCGAALPGDVRWCLRCLEPARELTPREPQWQPGEFVDNPIHEGRTVAHWSRWERSATTLGPVGRTVATVVTILWALSCAVASPLTMIFVLPVIGLVLHEIWQPGWVVPGDRSRDRRDASTPKNPPGWLWDRQEFVRSVGAAVAAAIGLGLLLEVHQPVVQFVVIVTGLVYGGYVVLRAIGGSRYT